MAIFIYFIAKGAYNNDKKDLPSCDNPTSALQLKKVEREKFEVKKKLVLAENPQFTQYIEQDFPVVETKYDTWTSKKVKVIGYCNPKKVFECYSFRVEVVKDYYGFISFIVNGKSSDTEGERCDVMVMRTDDFNKAYDLKIRLSSLLDYKPSEKEKMHCYGSLQREKAMWE